MSNNLSRGVFNVLSNDPLELNIQFQRIREELDEIQGLRGRAVTYDRLGVSTPTQNDDAAQLGNIPGSTAVVMGSTSISNEMLSTRVLRFVDANGTLIHSFGTTE